MTNVEDLQVLFRPRFELTAGPAESELENSPQALQDAARRWLGMFELGGFTEHADREEWYENVVQLFALLDHSSAPVHLITPRKRVRSELDIVRSWNGEFDSKRPCIFFGALHRHDLLFDLGALSEEAPNLSLVWPTRETIHAARKYGRNSAFKANANRRCHLATAPGDDVPESDPNEVCNVLQEWAKTGPVDAALKLVHEDKHSPLERVSLAKGASRKDAWQGLFRALEYTLLEIEGRPESILIQDFVPMFSEYRIFVVDGEPVTGAGCIEVFTPANRDPDTNFDEQVEDRRGEGEIYKDPELVERYKEFADRVAHDLCIADSRLRDFVLDLAVDSDGDILVIELNPVVNAGLYASNAEALTMRVLELAVERSARLREGNCPSA